MNDEPKCVCGGSSVKDSTCAYWCETQFVWAEVFSELGCEAPTGVARQPCPSCKTEVYVGTGVIVCENPKAWRCRRCEAIFKGNLIIDAARKKIEVAKPVENIELNTRRWSETIDLNSAFPRRDAFEEQIKKAVDHLTEGINKSIREHFKPDNEGSLLIPDPRSGRGEVCRKENGEWVEIGLFSWSQSIDGYSSFNIHEELSITLIRNKM